MSIALIFVLSLSASVLRCVDAAGGVSYQDKPCAQGEQASEIVLLDEYHYTPPEPDPETRRRRRPWPPVDQFDAYDPPLPEPQQGPSSWQCSANGVVFYRHDVCPATLPRVRDIMATYYPGDDVVPVRATRVSRSEACAAINARVAGERMGHDRDQRADPYDKLTGRDMCR